MTRASCCFIGHRLREAEIDGTVPLPVLRSNLEVLDEHVAERPQCG